MSSYVLHRLPGLWPDPERFDPGRFTRSDGPPGGYLPFLMGPHTCMGRQLAMMELPMFAAGLASAFRFSLPEGPPSADLRLSLVPGGFELGVQPR